MDVTQTGLSGLLLIEPPCYRDDRGFFLENFQAERYRENGITETFVQDNHSRSRQSVLRGLHFQVQRPQAQIVTVIRGRIFDVAVDLRPSSATLRPVVWCRIKRRRAAATLYGAWICPWFLRPQRIRRSALQSESGFTITPMRVASIWNDRDVGIRWPIANPIVSDRDSAFPALRQLHPERLPHAISSPMAGGDRYE